MKLSSCGAEQMRNAPTSRGKAPRGETVRRHGDELLGEAAAKRRIACSAQRGQRKHHAAEVHSQRGHGKQRNRFAMQCGGSEQACVAKQRKGTDRRSDGLPQRKTAEALHSFPLARESRAQRGQSRDRRATPWRRNAKWSTAEVQQRSAMPRHCTEWNRCASDGLSAAAD